MVPLKAWENKCESSLEEDIFIQDLKLFVLLVLGETTDNSIQENKSPYMRSDRIKNSKRKGRRHSDTGLLDTEYKKKKNPYCAFKKNQKEFQPSLPHKKKKIKNLTDSFKNR